MADDECKKEWAWCEPMAETAHGLFATQKEAICDAKQHFGEVVEGSARPRIRVAKVNFADPKAYIPDADEVVERMDEQAYGNEFSFWDDPIFEINTGGRTALKHLLESWVEDYVATCGVWVMVDGEEVDL